VASAQDAGPPPPQLDVDAAPPPMLSTPPPVSAHPTTPPAEGHAPEVDWSTRPSSGLGALIAGGIITGIGLANLATSVPICKSNSALSPKKQDQCSEIALGISGGITGVGVLLLIIGGSLRSSYNDWKKEHDVASHLVVAPVPHGAAGGVRFSF
jgi:hypothetical protein